MVFQMDASGDESHKSVGSGFKRLPPGRFHVEVMTVDESFQQIADKVVIEFEVLGGTVPGCEGTRHKEFYSMNAMDRLKRLALVCDLMKPGEKKDISFSSAIGSTLIIEIVPHSYKNDAGKQIDTTQMDFGGMFKLDDEEAEGVPRGKTSPKQEDGGGSADSGEKSDSNKWGDL